MSLSLDIVVKLQGRPAPSVYVCVDLRSGTRLLGITDADGRAHFPEIPDGGRPMVVVAAPIGHGCWRGCGHSWGRRIEIDCPAILDRGPLAWWHEAIGINSVDHGRGNGVRVGIADQAFKPAEGLEGLEILPLPGMAAACAPPGVSHGDLVARLIGNRSVEHGLFLGVAPGAQLLFVPLRLGPEDAGVEFRDIHPAIFQLIRAGVDIVSLSLGHRQDHPELRRVLTRAYRSGIICIAAAGNEGFDPVSFPARYPICASVGSVGIIGLGPPGSLVKDQEGFRRDPPRFGQPKQYFFPRECNFGTKIDVVAPGVGVVMSTPMIEPFDMSGTSFAAPIAAGALANGLYKDRKFLCMPRDEKRSDYMWGRLREMAKDLGMAADLQGCGLVRV